MTESATPVQQQAQPEAKATDKEYNFRRQQQMYERMIAERDAQLDELKKQAYQRREEPPEDKDDELYVNHKNLDKKLSSFERKLDEKIEKKAEERARKLLEQERQNIWLKSNPDFYDVLKHADTFAAQDPELAETILEMPDTFERQKLVYKNIKALGIHKPKVPEQTIQQKIDSNKRSPYYQPSGTGTPAYSQGGDFSPGGRKNAYDKVQELKKAMRLG